MTTSHLDPRLREAYLATEYRFNTPGAPLLLQVDRCSENLRQLLQRSGQACAAVLTAFNPGSQLQDESSNQRAQLALAAELQDLGAECIAGQHVDPHGRWPDEAGILAMGLGCDAARNLAARYGQLAFLWTDATATPRLMETIAGDVPRPTP